MALKTYKGSCHCGKIRIEADIDLDKGIGKCNCTMCTKIRHFGVLLKPGAFRLISGKEFLSDYQHGMRALHYYFCKECGVRPFAQGHLDMLGGEFYTVQVACLDDVDPKDVAAARVRVSDGRNNNWQNEPDVKGHL